MYFGFLVRKRLFLRPFLKENVIADVAELVDALDLGSSAFGRVGSIPSIRTRG